MESQRVAHVGTWRLDIETDQVEWSNELYKMYGFDPTLPPPPYTEHMKLFTPESWIELSTSLERTSTLGIPYELELQTVTKDGSNGWMWVRGEASRDSNGIITSLWGAARDITESKKAEAAIKESEEKFRYLFENSAVGKSVTLPSGEINVNATFCKMLGYTVEELKGKKWQELTHPDDIELTEREMNKIISGKIEATRFNKRFFKKDGSVVWVDVFSSIRRGEDGCPLYFMTSVIDITDRINTQEALKQSEKLFRTSFKSATVGGAMVAKDGAFIEVNDKACEIWGYGREELLQLKFTDITFKEDLVESIDLITKLLSGRVDNLSMEKRYVKKDGSLVWGLVSVSAIRDDNDEFEYFLAYIQNITEIKESENRLKYLSYHDQLTGLYNRRFFEEELSRLDAKRNLPISLIMADINGLKIINDSFGHDAGDDYLIKLAKVIKTTCRADEIVARLGGDEFAIILPNTSGQETASIVNRLQDTISKTKNGSFELSVSFGYDTKEREEQSVSDILVNAENHMYTHKIVERASMRSRTVEMIMSALFEKSGREAMHSKRVSKICEEIAAKMNFDRDDMEQIRTAGLVHDIGKIGIDEFILNKTGELKSEDWPAIRKHPEAGWRILNTTAEFSEIAQFVLHHHERFDGSGYPNGLKGEEIPIQARIIAIADAYDAMTNARSYRKAISHEEAIEELIRCSGTHFDPVIVGVFVR